MDERKPTMQKREPLEDGEGHVVEVTGEDGMVTEPFQSRPAPFNAVCRALQGERAYQQERWKDCEDMEDREGPDDRSIEEFLRYASDELANAEAALRDEEPARALEHVRKFTALGIATMEVHGAPRREGF